MMTREEKTIMWGLGMVLLIFLIWNISWYHIQLNDVQFRMTVVEAEMMDVREDTGKAVIETAKAADKLIKAAKEYVKP